MATLQTPTQDSEVAAVFSLCVMEELTFVKHMSGGQVSIF